MKIPQEVLMEALERAEASTDNPGFCLACGEEQEGCEPDAREYECECCGEAKVYGAQEILLMGAYK
jgi:hypothetical protein